MVFEGDVGLEDFLAVVVRCKLFARCAPKNQAAQVFADSSYKERFEGMRHYLKSEWKSRRAKRNF